MIQKIYNNISNIITISRLLLIPIFIISFYSQYKWNNVLCCIIFSIACFSDFLDGYLARKLNQVSDFGATLDHAADKLLVIIAIILIIEKSSSKYLCIPFLIIVTREIIILSIRELIAKYRERITFSFFYLGKFKTFCQMISIIMLLVYDLNKPNYVSWIGFIFFYLSSFITFYSMLFYIKNVINHVKKSNQNF